MKKILFTILISLFLTSLCFASEYDKKTKDGCIVSPYESQIKLAAKSLKANDTVHLGIMIRAEAIFLVDEGYYCKIVEEFPDSELIKIKIEGTNRDVWTLKSFIK